MKKIYINIFYGLISIIIAFCFVFLLKTFVGMPTTVKGTSMAKTFYPKEKLILSTWDANFNITPKRGEIVTFEAPSVDFISNATSNDSAAIYQENDESLGEKFLHDCLGISKKSYIKRVIGLPGEHIQIKYGKVYVDDTELQEDYIKNGIETDMSLGGEFSDVIVPEGYVYVLGDNRISSADSRRFGCIPIEKIEGKAVFRWWPLKRAGKVK